MRSTLVQTPSASFFWELHEDFVVFSFFGIHEAVYSSGQPRPLIQYEEAGAAPRGADAVGGRAAGGGWAAAGGGEDQDCYITRVENPPAANSTDDDCILLREIPESEFLLWRKNRKKKDDDSEDAGTSARQVM
jgi:hypothetical protein